MDNKTLSISILSGKGGVGKTNLALNLSYALHNTGRGVLLMDCDLGLANVDVMLGISPDRNLQDLLQPQFSSHDVVVPLEEPGFDFLPAASGVPELVEMDEDMQSVLFDKLTEVINHYDYLVLDLGAGINGTVLSFAAMTQVRVVVVTSEPTSLTDSYALMKVLNTQHGVKDFLIVVNQAESSSEVKQTFDRLHAACTKFLGINIRLLGSIRYDTTVTEAVRRQQALVRFAPQCNAAKDIAKVASKVARFREDNLQALAARPALRPFPGQSPDFP
jgi:flagellar biosynthesis protein FlhG